MIEKNDVPVYFLGIAIFFALKIWFVSAETNDLDFLLYPVSWIVSMFSGFNFNPVTPGGYFSEELNVVIEKSCSGFNFFLICYLMLGYLTTKYQDNFYRKILSLSGSLIIAYLLTVLVNSSRISISIILQGGFSLNKNHMIHEAIGVLNNLFFLILINISVLKLINSRKKYA